MDIGWLMLDLSHKSCLWMTDPILLRKLWCHVLFHDDWCCLSMLRLSCLMTLSLLWCHDPSWPHLSHDLIECFSLLKLYFNFYFFLLSPSFYIQLPFISNFLLYPPSFYIQLPFISSFLLYSTSFYILLPCIFNFLFWLFVPLCF